MDTAPFDAATAPVARARRSLIRKEPAETGKLADRSAYALMSCPFDFSRCMVCSRPLSTMTYACAPNCLHAVCKAHFPGGENDVCPYCSTPFTGALLLWHPLVQATLPLRPAKEPTTAFYCSKCAHVLGVPDELAIEHCLDCDSYLCNAHAFVHARKTHGTHSVSDLVPKPSDPTCHMDRAPLIGWCEDCHGLLCREECLVHANNDHHVRLVDRDFANGSRTRLIKIYNALLKSIRELNRLYAPIATRAQLTERQIYDLRFFQSLMYTCRHVMLDRGAFSPIITVLLERAITLTHDARNPAANAADKEAPAPSSG